MRGTKKPAVPADKHTLNIDKFVEAASERARHAQSAHAQFSPYQDKQGKPGGDRRAFHCCLVERNGGETAVFCCPLCAVRRESIANTKRCACSKERTFHKNETSAPNPRTKQHPCSADPKRTWNFDRCKSSISQCEMNTKLKPNTYAMQSFAVLAKCSGSNRKKAYLCASSDSDAPCW